MPIRPENRERYPADWNAISHEIRFVRAAGQCECDGRCGRHTDRCTAQHGETHPVTGSRVVLTTMHLNHLPEDCRPENLMAGCQRCHLAYDADEHARGRASRSAAPRLF